MYIDKYAISDVAIMVMTADTWSDADHSILKIKYSLRVAAHLVPTTNNTILTANVVDPSQIQATNFIKYVT